MSRIEPSDLRVYVIIDPSRFVSGEFETVTDSILSAGVRAIQLRDKEADRDDLLRQAATLRRLTARHDALLIINDHLDIALETGADGVHLGPGDLSVDEARSRAPGLIIGGSAGTVDRALELQAQGADYLGCGALWSAGDSKPDASEPRGVQIIRAVTSAVEIPVVGIGGITLERAPSVMQAGASGVAVIRAVLDAQDPGRAAAELLDHCSAAVD